MFNWSLLYLISEWTIPLVMLVYVPQRRGTAATRTWLLLIFLAPWPGLILYALFGRIHVPRNRIKRQEHASRQIRTAQDQMVTNPGVNPGLPPKMKAAARLATQLGDFEPMGGNTAELLTDYAGAIDRLIADIDSAKRHVHLLFYIFNADETGRRVADSVARASGRGVDCRVLMDAVGSKSGLAKLAPGLRKHGVEVNAMLPVGLFRRNAARYDLRNHRKIAVIDGSIGYTGSQNITDPYFVKDHPNEELLVRITGPTVAELQAVFLADQYFETGRILPREEMFPALEAAGSSPAQVVPSGPGYRHENGQELIIALLYAARERVVITTPYFVPDEPFLLAIRSAALRGVVVHLVVSRHANQLITQLAQRACYDALLEAGVRIYLYRPRFLHAKHISIDDDVALIGSTNIDIRSFALNAEINILFYDPAVVKDLRAIQEKYFADSDLLTAAEWNRRPLLVKVAQNTARLADSLL